jgi:hypothetical protein
MPENPHEYTLRRTWAADTDFVFVVEFIRLHGRRELYGCHRYFVHDAGGYKHWSMNWPESRCERASNNWSQPRFGWRVNIAERQRSRGCRR